MKRNSKTYRLQLIKETVEHRERSLSDNPMVRHIEHLLTDSPSVQSEVNMRQQHFVGHHFDEHIDGWVSDKWK
ncbi:hypothetical protein MACH09_04690 [Vibrio sp. MACH09]|uniref:hypothetical protein n=1 Tax=unclassified Vibrio TaxID=2614977 RepID=UPI00149376AD|nr:MULTISPECIES: hypothetical protein [unclassified Vibrio]NOI67273.1 hypothetical protein [Vibrio sp. 99-8-1]GLO59961.1 hypothetical protein MACH09_04690 [Vibrio sp. MACH09]